MTQWPSTSIVNESRMATHSKATCRGGHPQPSHLHRWPPAVRPFAGAARPQGAKPPTVRAVASQVAMRNRDDAYHAL
ncbi:hypothetical protein GW17_00015400 [Ensete ventricosum]|nr:hypothetical protein GW17_00015400 [Ensete ventricosum]RZS26106.1 hypothetical protein BHM03_00059410 [Ensete ventricosum]